MHISKGQVLFRSFFELCIPFRTIASILPLPTRCSNITQTGRIVSNVSSETLVNRIIYPSILSHHSFLPPIPWRCSSKIRSSCHVSRSRDTKFRSTKGKKGKKIIVRKNSLSSRNSNKTRESTFPDINLFRNNIMHTRETRVCVCV